MRVCEIGGQGVLEGVMMRGKDKIALGVRTKSGEIVLKQQKFVSKTKTSKFYSLPVIRGIVAFCETMFMGVGTITDAVEMYEGSNEETQPNKFEEYVAKKTGKSAMDVMMFFAVILAIGFSVILFFIIPNFLTGLVSKGIESSIVINLIEGFIRIAMFVGYVFAISFLEDVKRLFMFHGSEHKTINCYEHEMELNVENSMSMTTLNPRCGTSFMLIVMVIAILFFSLFGWSNAWYTRIIIRLLFLPIVAGVSYEVLKLLAKSENIFVRILRAPGMGLQKLTTSEPDESMVEVAILAFKAVEGSYTDEEIEQIRIDYSHGAADIKEDSETSDDSDNNIEVSSQQVKNESEDIDE